MVFTNYKMVFTNYKMVFTNYNIVFTETKAQFRYWYPYEVNGKLVTGNGSLIPICTLLPSLTVVCIHIMFHSKHLQCTLFNVALVLSGFVLAKSFISSLQQGRRARRTQLPMALINVFNFLSLQRV